MARTVTLCAGVHAVRIGDDLVFLDVAADRYLCWPGAESLALSADRGRLTSSDPGVLGDLEAAGLVTRSSCAVARFRAVAAPQGDLFEPGRRPTTWAERMDFVHGSLDGVALYPRQSFADLVRFAAARPPDATPDAEPGDDMRALVGAFHRWASWTPAPAKCLIRSFILLRLLRRHGFDARWVFAVRTWPFEAHCWLQAGALALDDARDRLTAYHPILVV